MKRLLLILLVACSSASAENPDETANEENPAQETPEPPAARATRVETAVVATSATDLNLRLPGEVEGSRDALLAASLGGYVEAVRVEEGDEVRSGQLIARVDGATHGARLAQTRVELDAAERELERAQQLGDAIAESQRDAAQSRFDAARAAQRTAQVQAGRASIRAPFAGTIATVNAERGEVMPPGAPVVRLVQLNPVHISLSVSDRDVVALQAGMEARVFVNAGGGARTGTVLRISPAADLQTRAFEAIVEVQNDERDLLPGMIAQVEIAAEGSGQQVVLPQYVLVTRLTGNGVFVADGGAARWKPVEVGSVVRDQAVITSGVDAGDEVIVTGHRELAEGDALLVARSGRCCTAGRVVFEGAP
ncbi:MAG: efflux RND transporter periplasmic adaptor subunit [Myxococcota bacterium]